MFKIFKEVEEVKLCNDVQVERSTLESIRNATEDSENLQKLISIVRSGWPTEKSKVPLEIRCYYNMRDQLTVEDGIIFKGQQIVIPT